MGDEINYYRGILSGPPAALERIRTRAGVDPNKESPFAYIDRSGTIHLAFDEAVVLAQKFCAAEPSTILVAIEATERKWAQDASRPGEEHLVSLLNEYRATWALLRQWSSLDAAVAEREAQIQKLERLVWDAIYALQKAGLDDQAARLRRALERRCTGLDCSGQNISARPQKGAATMNLKSSWLIRGYFELANYEIMPAIKDNLAAALQRPLQIAYFPRLARVKRTYWWREGRENWVEAQFFMRISGTHPVLSAGVSVEKGVEQKAAAGKYR